MRYFQFGTDEEIKNLAENSDKIKNFSFKKNSIDLKTFKGRYEIKDHSDSLNNPILIERVMGILIDLICLNQKFNIAPLLVQRIKETTEQLLNCTSKMVGWAFSDESHYEKTSES